RRLGILTLLWPDAMTPIYFLDRSLIRDTLVERECSLRNVRRLLWTKECQSRPRWDDDETSYGRAKKENNQSAQIKEAGSASGFLLHNKRMRWPPLVAEMLDGAKHFPIFLEYSWSRGFLSTNKHQWTRILQWMCARS